MTLPFSPNPISLFQVNCELYSGGTSCICLNNYNVRRLASTGNTGQSLNGYTAVSMANLRGHSRYYRDITTTELRPNIQADAQNAAPTWVATCGRYSASLTWATYNITGAGTVYSDDSTIPALTIPTMGQFDIVEVYNSGYVVGDGGLGDPTPSLTTGAAGTCGGTAVLSNRSLLLYNSGTIVAGGGGGGGGGGGDQNNNGYPGGRGGSGGYAVYGVGTITLYNTGGFIAGGGGGGGGGGGHRNANPPRGRGGGGGGGGRSSTINATGGAGGRGYNGNGIDGNPGAAGTFGGAGAGGTAVPFGTSGGPGGGWNVAGSPGGSNDGVGGPGGAAGISLVGSISLVVNTGTII